MTFNESTVEDAALSWFGELGYTVAHGAHPAPGRPAGRGSHHPLRGGAVMTAGGTAELRRPLNRAEHQATMARLAMSPRTWNRAIHRAIVARFGEAGCLMTAACNASTVEDAVLAWSMDLAHSHPGSRDILATECHKRRSAPASFPAIYPANMAGRVFQRIPSRNAPWYPMP